MSEAKKSYKTASRIDESSMLACLGKEKSILIIGNENRLVMTIEYSLSSVLLLEVYKEF